MPKATTLTTNANLNTNTGLGYFKLHDHAPTPQFSTKESCCFDLAFNAAGNREVKGYNRFNNTITRSLVDTNGALTIVNGDRLAVPTGLILQIPAGFSVRVHARSGMAFKQGLVLTNSEGVIDSDYFHELYVLLTNVSDTNIVIQHGDRIAQAEMVPVLTYDLNRVSDRPAQRTDRVGGLGSTG